MTYAPAAIVVLGRYWVSKGGVNLGIVGDSAHLAKGVSYHLGKSSLAPDAYSAKTARDRAGLTEAASAIDLGKLNGNLGQLRTFSLWFVEQCRSGTLGTTDVREFIYSPDGKVVLRWDRERGFTSEPRPGEADSSHFGHSHISFYRDSEQRSKVELFAPYFADTSPKPEVDLMLTPALDPAEYRPLQGVRVKAGTRFYRQAATTGDSVGLNTTTIYPLFGNTNASTAWRGVLVNTAAFYTDGKPRQTIGFIQGSAIAETVDLPIPQPDCSAAVAEAVKPLQDEIGSVRSEVSSIRTLVTDLAERVDKALDALA